MQGAPHILIVDDHREIRDLVSRALSKEGFRVSTAADGRTMRKVLADSRIDLILLDLMLPGEDGLSLCRALRAGSNIPIIMLTAKGDEVDRVIGLEMGADDYLPKPFGSRELIARIRAVLRRSREKAATANPEHRPKRYHFDRWGLDTGARELVRDDGVTVPLSTGEYDLLIALVERPQRVLSRDQLLDLARGRSAAGLDRSIDTQVSRLRKKLELDPSDPKIIKTVWGGGYMFTPTVSPRMSRLLPKSLFGQTLLILLAGLILSHAVGSWIYTVDREQAVRAVGGFAAAQRIANLTRLVQDTPHEGRERMVAALSDQSFRVSLSHRTPGNQDRRRRRTGCPGDQGLSGRSAVAWAGAAASRIRCRPGWHRVRSLASDDGPRPDDARFRRVRNFAGFRDLQVAVPCRMASGSRSRPPCRRAARPSRVSSSCRWESWRVIILAVSVWAVRRVTAPLASLSAAAERLGNDLNAPPMPETGTIETRQASRAFNTMQARLRSLIENRTRMLAAISHDLRTPLTLLRLRAENSRMHRSARRCWPPLRRWTP